MDREPYDEQEILPDDLIIRRINPKYHVVWDENRNRYRVSSAAFNKTSRPFGGMSVDIEKLILAANIEPKLYVTNPVFTASVSFKASEIRSLGLLIGYEPVEATEHTVENPFHGEVWDNTARKSFTDAQKRGLASFAVWYVELPDTDLA